jgi:hypothetical protein
MLLEYVLLFIFIPSLLPEKRGAKKNQTVQSPGFFYSSKTKGFITGTEKEKPYSLTIKQVGKEDVPIYPLSVPEDLFLVTTDGIKDH